MKKTQIEVIEEVESESAFHKIRIKEGKFQGVIFSFGVVKLTDEEHQLRLSFDYTLHHVPESVLEYDQDEMKSKLGDILVHLIETTYGAVDVENREDHSLEFDS